MANRTRPFAGFEFLIAWRYLRARRAEGGVSVMTWISFVGVTLGVMALVATLAVRAGFRAEFVDTIVGSNAHATVFAPVRFDAEGGSESTWRDHDSAAARIAAIPGVTRAAPIVYGQVMATVGERARVAEVYGLTAENLRTIPRIGGPGAEAVGEIGDFTQGVAIGSGLARDLGLILGDKVKLISPNGVKTAFGTSPRVSAYEVVYIFTAGRWDIDRTRLYMPMAEAQLYFDREGQADQIEVYVDDPEQVEDWTLPLIGAAGEGSYVVTWHDTSGAFLNALKIEDDVMFVILSVLVLIAAMNITSGLVMLVKNKGRDIGILRTMGLTQGSVMRVFFICGAATGIAGTAMGLILGCLIAIYVEPIMVGVNWLSGGGAWDPSIRGLYRLPAKLLPWDIFRATALSLGLAFGVTVLPARRAARMNPVEALRYE